MPSPLRQEKTPPHGKTSAPSRRVDYKQDADLETSCSDSSTTSTEGYSMDTFTAEDVSESSLHAEDCSSATNLGDTGSDIGGTYASGTTSVGEMPSAICRPPDQGGGRATEETAMRQADTAGAWSSGAYNVTAVPRQIERSTNQTAFPGLAEDARIFAKKLARLAEGGML